MEGMVPGNVAVRLPLVDLQGGRVDVPIFFAGVCAYCSDPTFAPPCSWCCNHLCAACSRTHWRFCAGSRCACGALARVWSCQFCYQPLCNSCRGVHTCLQNGEFEDSPRGSLGGDSPSLHSEEENRVPEAGTGGCDRADDMYDQVTEAWNAGGSVQLKYNICVCVQRVDEEWLDDGLAHRRFGSMEDFKRIADELAWDIPNGFVVIHLVRKKCLVFMPGRGEANAAGIDAALSWAKHYDALTIAIRGSAPELAVLDVTWFPGQSSRLSFFISSFIAAVRAVSVEPQLGAQ